MVAGQSILASSMGRKRREPNVATYSGRIAARLRELREELGKSVEEMARKLKLPMRTLYRYESGERPIPPDAYPDLAKGFRLSVREFMPEE